MQKRLTWEDIYRIWRAEFKTAKLLFRELAVHDPTVEGGAVLLWCEHERINRMHVSLQRHLDESPGGGGLNVFGYVWQLGAVRKGEFETLHYLWESRDNPEIVAATLIAGSLFSRVRSSRGLYPRENWPPFRDVKGLYDTAMEQVPDISWHYSCTQVLPYQTPGHREIVDSLPALVRYLAREHTALLERYAPVAMVFGPKKDPFVGNRLKHEYLEKQKQQAKLDREFKETARLRAEEQARQTEEHARKKREHPRWGEWTRVTPQELEHLIWSKPATAIARDFGVSDVAVAKKCKKMGIPRPPRGFWARVQAGKLPHPKGAPQK